MKVTLLDPSLALATKYGKLSIPATEVRPGLDFGFRYPDGLEEKINKAIGELGSSEFKTREDAEQALANVGHFAIPALLRRAVKGEDPEAVRRAQAVLRLLENKLGEGKAELRDYDVVETAEFTREGPARSRRAEGPHEVLRRRDREADGSSSRSARPVPPRTASSNSTRPSTRR